MSVAGKMVVGARRWTPGFSFSGGSWLASYPAAALADHDPDRPAWSADAAPASTKFYAVSQIARPVSLMGFVRHNASVNGRFRIKLYADAAMTALLYDGGWVDFWPMVYPCGTQPFESSNFLWGRYAAEDVAGRLSTRPVWLGKRYLARAAAVEISDADNPSALGVDYQTPPQVIFSGGGGAGAAATAVIDAAGRVASYAVTAGGSGYASAPAVAVLDPTGRGRGAVAKATISGGAVTAVAPARYFRCGVFEIADGWQWSYNPSRGMRYGPVFKSQIRETDGGRAAVRRIDPPTSLEGSVNYMPRDEAMAQGLEFLRRYDLDVPFLVVPNPDNPTHWPREVMFAVNRDPGMMTRAAAGYDSFPFKFVEA